MKTRFWFRAQRVAMLLVMASAAGAGALLGEMLSERLGLHRPPLSWPAVIAVAVGATSVQAFRVWRRR